MNVDPWTHRFLTVIAGIGFLGALLSAVLLTAGGQTVPDFLTGIITLFLGGFGGLQVNRSTPL